MTAKHQADSGSNNENPRVTKRVCIARTPQKEDHGDEVHLLETLLQDPEKFLGETTNPGGSRPVHNEGMPTMSERDQENSELLYGQLKLLCKLSRMGPAVPSSDAPIYGGICTATSGMAVAALQAAHSEGLLGRLESRRLEAQEKVKVRDPDRANGEAGGLNVHVEESAGEDLRDIYSSSG